MTRGTALACRLRGRKRLIFEIQDGLRLKQEELTQKIKT